MMQTNGVWYMDPRQILTVGYLDRSDVPQSVYVLLDLGCKRLKAWEGDARQVAGPDDGDVDRHVSGTLR